MLLREGRFSEEFEKEVEMRLSLLPGGGNGVVRGVRIQGGLGAMVGVILKEAHYELVGRRAVSVV
jgi:hypothetical protein